MKNRKIFIAMILIFSIFIVSKTMLVVEAMSINDVEKYNLLTITYDNRSIISEELSTGSEFFDKLIIIIGIIAVILIVKLLDKKHKEGIKIYEQREKIRRLGDNYVITKIKDEFPKFSCTIFKKEAEKLFMDFFMDRQNKLINIIDEESFSNFHIVITDFWRENDQLVIAINLIFSCINYDYEYDVVYTGSVNETNDGYNYVITKSKLYGREYHGVSIDMG